MAADETRVSRICCRVGTFVTGWLVISLTTFAWNAQAGKLKTTAPPATSASVVAPPPPPTPPAGPPSLSETLSGDAKSAYDAAKVLFGDGDFASAALKFRSAHDLSNDPRLLWNIAACEKNLRHYAKVVSLVQR